MILASQVYRENLPPVVDADGELVAFDGTPVVTFWRNGEVDVSITPTIEQYSTGLYVVEATITGSVGDSVWCSVFVADMDPTTIVLPVRILQSVPTVAQIQTIDDELATVDGLIDGIVAGSTVVRANNSAGEVILPTSGYTAPDNAGIAAIKAKTDNLPADPASETTVAALPSAAAIAAAVWAFVIAGGYSAAGLLRGFAAVFLGKIDDAGTATNTFRDVADTKDAVVVSTDEYGNRSSVTLDLD